jgi:hypothetical protein
MAKPQAIIFRLAALFPSPSPPSSHHYSAPPTYGDSIGRVTEAKIEGEGEINGQIKSSAEYHDYNRRRDVQRDLLHLWFNGVRAV